jgi:hypothetical protein
MQKVSGVEAAVSDGDMSSAEEEQTTLSVTDNQ